jgi:hypothetical protein
MEDWLDEQGDGASGAVHDKFMRDREYELLKSEYTKVWRTSREHIATSPLY